VFHQIANQTAIGNQTIVTKLQFIRIKTTRLHRQTKNDVI